MVKKMYIERTSSLAQSPLNLKSCLSTLALHAKVSSKEEKSKLHPAYVSGFIDGEGCFSLSFRRFPRLKVGVEVIPSFSIGQKITVRNDLLLKQFKLFFKGGAIRVDKRGLYKYETRSIDHIMREIVPFFKKHPFLGEKLLDFQLFCEACSLLAAKEHLHRSGLLKILAIAEKMNRSGQRRTSLSDLRVLLEKREQDRSSDLHK